MAFDEVAGIKFKDKDDIQIMKDYMASGSFARGKEEKAASASMVFVGNINQSVDVLLKTSSLFDPFPPEMGTDTAFLDRIHGYNPGWEIPKFRPEHFTDDYGFISDYLAGFMRELRKEQYGDALDAYFRLGKNLNQRDTIAVRKMVGGYIKLLYPDGRFSKDEVEEVLQMALEMRRRVKEQLKKLGGMEFYDVNFSYIDNETFEEHYVSVPEQGGGKLIPEGLCNPGQVYTVSHGKNNMIGVFRLESQMLPGSGKFERTGIGSDRIDQWVIETLPSTVSPAFFPSVVTLVLIIMSALLTGFCLRSVRHMLAGKVDEERLELQEGGEEAGRFAALAGYVGILFLYLIGLHFIGFVYSTPIVMFLVSLMLGLRHWLIGIVCYVLFTLLLNYVAFNFMQIILPTGVLFG